MKHDCKEKFLGKFWEISYYCACPVCRRINADEKDVSNVVHIPNERIVVLIKCKNCGKRYFYQCVWGVGQ